MDSADEKLNKEAVARLKNRIPKYNPKRLLRPTLANNRLDGRTPPLNDAFDQERQMYQSLMGSNHTSNKSNVGVTKPKSNDSKQAAIKPTTGKTEGNASSLLTSMAARLRILEQSQREMRNQLVSKEKEILSLKSKLSTAEVLASGESNTASEIQTLKDQNETLRQQVYEMETFLNDYGLVWVGTKHTNKENASSPENNEFQPNARYRIDLDTIIRRIKELNVLAGEGKQKIVHKNGAAQFCPPESIPITLFQDGFMLRRGPFRSYDENASKEFFTDIMDGYYPIELKDIYPDGVVFELHDRRTEAVQDETKEDNQKENVTVFGGRGHRLNGTLPRNDTEHKEDSHTVTETTSTSDTNSRQVSSYSTKTNASKQKPIISKQSTNSAIHSLASMGDHTFSLSSEEFLSSIPDTVVRNGQVLEIKSGIADLLGNNKEKNRSDIIVVRTPVVEALCGHDSQHSTSETSEDASMTTRPVTPYDVATIQVRSGSGKQILVIKLRFTDTIRELRSYIDAHRTKTSEYQLRTSFPVKAYEDLDQTLIDAGLAPNATVMIRPIA